MFYITFQNDNGTLVLGDDNRKNIIVSDYRHSSPNIIQQAARPRADQVECFDRRNVSTVLTWTSRYEFTNAARPFAFMKAHPFQLIGRGKLLVIVNHGGDYVKELLQKACMSVEQMTPRGVELFVNYRAVGGLLV